MDLKGYYMLKIRKYPFTPSGNFSVEMKVGAKVLCAKMRNEQTVLYALVDTEADDKTFVFASAQTGDQTDLLVKGGRYIGTINRDNPLHALHVFQCGQY